MPTDYVQKAIRRSNRNILIASLLGLVVLVAAAALSYRYLVGFFKGPEEVAKPALLALKTPDQLTNYYVTVKGDDAEYTGYQRVSTSDSGPKTVKGSFMALLFNDRYLLVEVPGESRTAASQYTGALVPIESGIPSQVIGEYEKDSGMTGAALPFMLDTSDFRSNGYIGLGVGLIVFLLCVWGLSKVIRRSGNPASHPIMRALGRFGEPEQVAEQINQEMSAPHEALGSLHLTPHWLVNSAGVSLAATRLEDVVWVYGKVAQHRTNGVPTGKTYSTLIWDRYGKNVTVTGKEKAMQDALQAVYRRAPWAIVGYRADVEKAWKSNRPSVLAAVEQRRQEMAQQAQAQPT